MVRVPFGSYMLHERIAVGGMAEIYRATDAAGRLCAIKKILPNLAEDEDFIRMFANEARLMSHLRHPKIVRVFEMGVVENAHFMALEYVHGTDLLRVLRSLAERHESMPTKLAVLILDEVLDALDHAHGATGPDGRPLRIVHRDISPGNVLLSSHGAIKVADFGIARAATSEETQGGVLKGKYGYMSPEQIMGHAIDCRSDLYSCGVILAEMLMGRRLFYGESDLETLLMVRDGRLDRLFDHGGHIEPALLAVILCALSTHPDARYASATAFRTALGPWRARDRVDVEVARLVASLERPRHRGDDHQVYAHLEVAPIGAGPDAAPEEDSAPGDSRDTVEDIAPVHGAPGETINVVQGILEETPALRMLHRLMVHEEEGLWVVESGGQRKEIYLTGGIPQYVASNVPDERFGEFLLARGALERDQLDTALERMRDYGGHLGDTLIAMGLFGPLEIVRLLAAQVREKLVRLCAWEHGTYRWHPGRQNPHPWSQLDLDAYEILGAGAMRISAERVSAWASEHGADRPRAAIASRAALDAFQLGELPHQLCRLLDGSRSVSQVQSDLGAGAVEGLRTLYLLVHTGRVTLD